jgi:hypothetical protein
MKTSRLASSVTSHSLIIVREFDLMQGISEPYPGSPASSLMSRHVRYSENSDGREKRGVILPQ